MRERVHPDRRRGDRDGRAPGGRRGRVRASRAAVVAALGSGVLVTGSAASAERLSDDRMSG